MSKRRKTCTWERYKFKSRFFGEVEIICTSCLDGETAMYAVHPKQYKGRKYCPMCGKPIKVVKRKNT